MTGGLETNLLQQLSECRPEVLKFAVLMEKVLKQNDHKGGWKEVSLDYLNRRLIEEVAELLHETASRVYPKENAMTKEAVDVANFCMFLVDNFGNLDGIDDRKEAVQ